jgi:PAS domain-containing protein
MEKESPVALTGTPHVRHGEARLHLALEETGLAIWETDFQRRESLWSANHFRLFGYPVDPTGRATLEMWSARLHPADRSRVLAELHRAKRRRELYRSEYRIVRADTGETSWLESRGRFL